MDEKKDRNMKPESKKPVEGEIIEQTNDVSHSKSVEIRTVEDVYGGQLYPVFNVGHR